MKKLFKIFLIIILALFFIYQVYDFFWQRNRELAIEQSIVAMQNSADELKNFCIKNAEDIEYLVAKSIDEQMIFYRTSVDIMGQGNPKDIDVDQNLTLRRDRLIEALPNLLEFQWISPEGIRIRNEMESDPTIHIMITSPPFTSNYEGHTAGVFGTVDLEHTWTFCVGANDYSTLERAKKAFDEMQ